MHSDYFIKNYIFSLLKGHLVHCLPSMWRSLHQLQVQYHHLVKIPINNRCLARIDLAGAWTDTPPQAYEFGGLVSTMAIKISGKVSGCVYHTVLDVIVIILEHLSLYRNQLEPLSRGYQSKN